MVKANNMKWDICIYVNFRKICNNAHIAGAHGSYTYNFHMRASTMEKLNPRCNSTTEWTICLLIYVDIASLETVYIKPGFHWPSQIFVGISFSIFKY